MLPVADYLFLSLALLLIGIIGVITRRNLVIKLFSIELILTAASINCAAFGRSFSDGSGAAFSIFLAVIVAVQILVALAIMAAVFTRWHTTSPGPETDPPEGAAAN